MTRFSGAWIGAAAGLALCHATLAEAQPRADSQRLWQVLQLDALMQLMAAEALAEAETMEQGSFPRGGDGLWLDVVAEIHDPATLESLFREGVSGAVEAVDPQELDQALDFYATALGQRVIGLELSAREVVLDPAAEEDAESDFAFAQASDHPRVDQIQRFIESGDLLDLNVAGAMNAALAFSFGYEEAGGYQMPMSEQQLLADVWGQEAQIREDVESWMLSYLFLAYSPLSDADLEAYIRFQASDAGHALSRVLSAGFDRLFTETSHNMGFAFATQMRGREL